MVPLVPEFVVHCASSSSDPTIENVASQPADPGGRYNHEARTTTEKPCSASVRLAKLSLTQLTVRGSSSATTSAAVTCGTSVIRCGYSGGGSATAHSPGDRLVVSPSERQTASHQATLSATANATIASHTTASTARIVLQTSGLHAFRRPGILCGVPWSVPSTGMR